MHLSTVTSGRLVADRAGRYLVCGTVGWNGATTGRRLALLYKNGAVVDHGIGTIPADPGGGVVRVSTPSIIMTLDLNEYVELWASHNFTASLSVRRADSSLTALYVGPV
jgi:hypothetical protein